MLRRFHFQRQVDLSGVSGCGAVAFGVVFADGQVALHWEGCHASINIYRSISDLMFVHGHNGATELVWDDAEMTISSPSKEN